MSIEKSRALYDKLKKDSATKKLFYHFSTITGLYQYELLFNYIDRIRNKETLSVLDWGCGNGWFTYYLLNNGFKRVISYGFGWDTIDNAKSIIPNINYINGYECNLDNPSKLPFEDNSFDLIFSIGVLEHVHETGGDQTISLNEIHRIMKPKGKFYCYHLPNKLTWIEFIKGVFLKDKKKYNLHTKKFNRANIECLLAQSQMNLPLIKRYNLLPYNFFEIRFSIISFLPPSIT